MDMLDERKAATSRDNLRKLAQKYGLDLEKLESVSKFVTSPSVVANSAATVVQQNGEQNVSTAVSSYNDLFPFTDEALCSGCLD